VRRYTCEVVNTQSELFVDYIEQGWAMVVHGDRQFPLPVDLLPPDVKPGDWVRVTASTDPEARRRLAQSIEDLQREVTTD
jgi:hypothetical protein